MFSQGKSTTDELVTAKAGIFPAMVVNMITSLASIIIAFYWLMKETDWLRVNLMEETLAEYDTRVLKEMEDKNKRRVK